MYCIPDIDECISTLHDCQDTCVNTEGSYMCECSEIGTQLASNQRSCIGLLFIHDILLFQIIYFFCLSILLQVYCTKLFRLIEVGIAT